MGKRKIAGIAISALLSETQKYTTVFFKKIPFGIYIGIDKPAV